MLGSLDLLRILDSRNQCFRDARSCVSADLQYRSYSRCHGYAFAFFFSLLNLPAGYYSHDTIACAPHSLR